MTKVLVTGCRGFFGQHIVSTLQQRGYSIINVPDRTYLDFRQREETYDFIRYSKPDCIIHAAAYSGGITFNKEHPRKIYEDNVQMSLNILSAAASCDNKPRLESIISSCAYPDTNDSIIYEEDFWKGLPNKSIRFFGLQKRNIAAHSMALATQYPDRIFTWPVVNNLYGENDSIELNRTKVVMALIHKFSQAKKDKAGKVVCLGTGAPLRQFTYVKDAANAVVDVLEKYDDSFNPINITTPEETSIKTLAETVAELVGYDGVIEWDISCSDGQMRKAMSGEKAENILGRRQWTSLRDGLRQTIEWYRQTQ